MDDTPSQKRPILYRFMPAKWALKSIKTRELRVGRLAELNDPFEFVPGIEEEDLPPAAPRDVIRHQMWKVKEDFNPMMGVLSFSSTPEEPTLWSHYAESHKGIALGFDFPPNVLGPAKVTYPPSSKSKRAILYPGTRDPTALEVCFRKTIITKASGWKAESEYRIVIDLIKSDCRLEQGDYFLPITDSNCILVEVILGCRCTIGDSYVDQLLERHGFEGARLLLAKPSISTFELEFSPSKVKKPTGPPKPIV